ncbi:putative protein phosphatase 2C 60 [Hibiscus syriacus]|uniref:PPM-type phosphatase domain-containing protein n=1 Tax=Hibiscus syriacus TaxID=106335 RepID=A0A6A3CQH4_HIBSY|nr:putative protein phosphatase 2C 60 [Hibiscus syriacus]
MVFFVFAPFLFHSNEQRGAAVITIFTFLIQQPTTAASPRCSYKQPLASWDSSPSTSQFQWLPSPPLASDSPGYPPLTGPKGHAAYPAAYPDLDDSTSFFDVYDGHGGKVVAKFCAKYLHQQVLKQEAYAAGDIGTSLQKAFFRMDEMMRGQRGWRELAVLGDKIDKFTGMIEGLIWSPKGSDGIAQGDDWAFEEARGLKKHLKWPNAPRHWMLDKLGGALVHPSHHLDHTSPGNACRLFSFCGGREIERKERENKEIERGIYHERAEEGCCETCVAVIRNNQLLVANAGDSRCVISRKGQAYNLSRDHKPDLEAEKERILKAGGFIHAGRVNGSLNLSRAIVLPAEKQIVSANPDINTVELCDDDEFLVLACDGIWDCMSSQMLVDFIHEQLHSESKLPVICERVLNRCLAPSTANGEGCDNMTMILVQFKKPIKSDSPEEQQCKSVDTESTP